MGLPCSHGYVLVSDGIAAWPVLRTLSIVGSIDERRARHSQPVPSFMTSASLLLPSLLQAWQPRLLGWAADRSLTAAAREALRLAGEPRELTALISQWAAGDFSALPPIVVPGGSVLPGAAGVRDQLTDLFECLDLCRRVSFLAEIVREVGTGRHRYPRESLVLNSGLQSFWRF